MYIELTIERLRTITGQSKILNLLIPILIDHPKIVQD